jgi:hypothetical protein
MATRILNIVFKSNVQEYQLRTKFFTQNKYRESIRERILTEFM